MMKRLSAIVLLVLVLLMTTGDRPAQAATRIRFDDFFIGETYQVGPGMGPTLQLSDTIQKLNGKQIEIVGFMDGILPRDGMYFMLIREPNFMCPFHTVSFDWAGFVPIFLKKSTDYIDGPVQIVGRLEVGKKEEDEMGLRSYIRIYDATITPVN